MTTLLEVRDALAKHADGLPAGRRNDIWVDFVSEAETYMGVDPGGQAASNLDVDTDFAEFWLDAAVGRSDAYDAMTGGCRDAAGLPDRGVGFVEGIVAAWNNVSAW